MKTTLDLPDELVRAVKNRAVEEHRQLKDLIAELLRHGLALQRGGLAKPRRRLQLPLVECAHEARPEEEMTPDRVSDVLLKEEAGLRRDALR